jgi:carbamoyltransferase
MSTVIGISGLYHDSAAALVVGGEIVAAAQEERFTRRKHDSRFPEHALAFCVARAGGPQRIDAVAFYEDPVLAFDRVLRNAIDLAPDSEKIWPATAAAQLLGKLPVLERLQQIAPEVLIVDHHLSHLASAFYPSPFPDAAVVVVDGVGEWATTTIADAADTTITPIDQIHYPHSLGLFYSAFTHHCGLKVNSGEYKLMGLAPYGTPRYVNLILEHLIDLREDGSFHLNTEYFGFLTGDRATNTEFERLLGCPRRHPQTPLTPVYMDLAASAQAVLNQAMLGIARRALAVTGRRNLCLAGGVALNCVANGELRRKLAGLEGLWIQPAAGDAGGALGAALQVAHHRFGHSRKLDTTRADAQKGSLLGPSYSDTEIKSALDAAGLTYHTITDTDEHVSRVAQALQAGLIVGRFAGALEFGPRALGNRSILADARLPDGQRHINLRIKFRESWRPFAPAVLAEHAATYFDLRGESPYMLLVSGLREEWREPYDPSSFVSGDPDMMKLLNQRRSFIPAVTHIDYSARLQTVNRATHPGLHRLLEEFHRLTGCPVLVNTSFNVRGEPIVCAPTDAVSCFLNTGIDVLAIGSYLAFKAEQPEALRSREGSVTYETD